MRHRRGPLLVLALAMAGCGGGTGSDASPQPAMTHQPAQTSPAGDTRVGGPAAALPPAPAPVLRRCHTLAASRQLRVLCPQRLPQGRWVVNHETLRNGPCQYLLDLETRPFGSGGAFHILAGGRCGPWPMAAPRGRWPARVPLRPDLGLVGTKALEPGQAPEDQRYVRLRVLRRAQVAGHAALVLAAAPYPDGGVHGGHTVAVWNEGGSGYTLTMHFRPGDRRGTEGRQALVLRTADTMARSSAG
jgi:hypothetical protein